MFSFRHKGPFTNGNAYLVNNTLQIGSFIRCLRLYTSLKMYNIQCILIYSTIVESI